MVGVVVGVWLCNIGCIFGLVGGDWGCFVAFGGVYGGVDQCFGW